MLMSIHRHALAGILCVRDMEGATRMMVGRIVNAGLPLLQVAEPRFVKLFNDPLVQTLQILPRAESDP